MRFWSFGLRVCMGTQKDQKATAASVDKGYTMGMTAILKSRPSRLLSLADILRRGLALSLTSDRQVQARPIVFFSFQLVIGGFIVRLGVAIRESCESSQANEIR